MEHVSHDIERLIVRRLDSALTENETLQLNRELIRNPEAQRLLEDYARVDAIASAALGEVLGGSDDGFDSSLLTPRLVRRGWRDRYHRGWWLVPGAVAAALLALVIPKPGLDGGRAIPSVAAPKLVGSAPTQTSVPVSHANTYRPAMTSMPGDAGISTVAGSRRSGSDLMRHVSDRPQHPTLRRRTGREVIGVMGDDGNLYWIEVDRTRTIRQTPDRRLFEASEAM